MDKKNNRIHIIANCYKPTSRKYLSDAFNELSIKLARMFHRRKHIVYFYGVYEYEPFALKNNYAANVECTKYIDVIDIKEYDEAMRETNDFEHPGYMMVGCKKFDKIKANLESIFYWNLIGKLKANCLDQDIVLHVIDNFNVTIPGKTIFNIKACHMGGYNAIPHVVFVTEDYRRYIMHDYDDGQKHSVVTSTVIHPWFYLADFDFAAAGPTTNTYLYLARCQNIKGLGNYLNISKSFPNDIFLIAGGCASYDQEKKILNTGETENSVINLADYPNVKYIGILNLEQRKKILSQVTALIQPTVYREPCGWNVIEAMISGTPSLVPNFGGFLNTVEHGVTGYICTQNDWCENLGKIKNIDRNKCRKIALEKFTEDRAYRQYIDYFDNIINDNQYIQAMNYFNELIRNVE